MSIANTDLTRQELNLGTRDTVTGWCAKVYASSVVQGSIQPQGGSAINLPVGNYAKYPHTLFTPDVCHTGDIYTDANSDTYLVKARDLWWYADQFSHYVAKLEKLLPNTLRPSTSGTWHTDSTTYRTDSRYRLKSFLEQYIVDASVTKDASSTQASWIAMFAGADYPLTLEFQTNNIDLICTIEKGAIVPKETHLKEAYAYDETMILQTWALNKTGITADNLLEKFYKEVERVFKDQTNNLGSYRRITRAENKPVDLDGFTLYSNTITLSYSRNNPEYAGSSLTLTYADSQGSTYTFPNILEFMLHDPDSGDTRLGANTRLGTILQICSSDDIEIHVKSDLDFCPDSLTWLRPQASTSKTDVTPWQVFGEIKFGGKYSSNQIYQNLNWAGVSLPVRLIDIQFDKTSEHNYVSLIFKGYNSASATSYTSWYGFGT